RDHGSAYAERLHVLGIVVHARRNGGREVVRCPLDECVDLVAADIHENRVAGGHRLGDRSRRVTNGEGERIVAVVAVRLRLRAGRQFGRKGEAVHGPAVLVHQQFHGIALAGTGVPDVHPLAFEVLEVGDARVGTRHHGKRLRVQREERAQTLEWASIRKLLDAVDGIVLNVRLHYTDVELTLADGVDVEDGAARRFRRTADAVLGAGAVNVEADRAAGRVVDARDTTGADGHELLLGDRRR